MSASLALLRPQNCFNDEYGADHQRDHNANYQEERAFHRHSHTPHSPTSATGALA